MPLSVASKVPAASINLQVDFAGQEMLLDGRGALYWPEKSLLLVSDLHLEKGSYLRQYANPIPGYDTRDTLLRLEALIEEYKPRMVVCLGDSFHDGRAGQRLLDDDRMLLNELTMRCMRWIWITGNHDPEPPKGLLGELHDEIALKDIIFRHEPDPEDEGAQVFGHFHPKISCKIARHKITGKCFLHDGQRLMMPAFGSFTGGLSVTHTAIASQLQAKNTRHYLIHNEKVWPV